MTVDDLVEWNVNKCIPRQNNKIFLHKLINNIINYNYAVFKKFEDTSWSFFVLECDKLNLSGIIDWLKIVVEVFLELLHVLFLYHHNDFVDTISFEVVDLITEQRFVSDRQKS